MEHSSRQESVNQISNSNGDGQSAHTSRVIIINFDRIGDKHVYSFVCLFILAHQNVFRSLEHLLYVM